MTSIRENIAVDIANTLREDPETGVLFKKVIRGPMDWSVEVARTSFPFAVVTSADEERDDLTMGGSTLMRQGVITYWIDIHVNGSGQDEKLNELIELVEESLDVDRTRGANALDTQVSAVQLLDPESLTSEWTSARVFVTVEYCFTRGAA